jgi:glycosyltransferase involved in cell wall biosynthesis
LSQDSFEALREELEKTRAELSQERARIAAMEMSFFWKLRNAWWRLKTKLGLDGSFGGSAARPAVDAEIVHVPGFAPVRFRGHEFGRSTDAVDVVVLAHDDLPVLEECLGALLRHARPPYKLFLADSGVSAAARTRLEAFARDQGAALVGGADAFQKARDAGTSRHVLLLDGCARVAADVLDRLFACLASDGDTSGVVPLAADVPGVGPAFESAARALAEGGGAPATFLAADSARLFPKCEEGGGCALLVRRPALRSGGSERSPREVLARMRADAKRILLADDTWVAGASGASAASTGAPDRVAAGIAARLAILPERVGLRESARRRFEGKRVLYLLPVLERGGGSNVVLSEARAMMRMGVEARVFNLAAHRSVFEKSYPAPGVPIVYGRESDLVEAAHGFDAVIGTAHYSVPWMVPLAKLPRPPVLGYCIQDYEPLFYAEGSEDWKRAFASYGLVPGMRQFSKSKWNADEVIARTGLDCALVSASFDAEVFRPRLPEPPASPVRIAAMVRPSTPRRQPGLTVDVMRALGEKLGDRVEIVLFGSEKSDPALRSLRLDFPHRFLGVLDDRQLSALLSQVHVFADLSTYQALGVASLEAMGSGAAVVVPKAGGAGTFARHEVNALAVDTSSREACLACLERLATDESLLRRLAAQAIADAGFHTPDRAAAGILEVLFAEA